VHTAAPESPAFGTSLVLEESREQGTQQLLLSTISFVGVIVFRLRVVLDDGVQLDISLMSNITR
jgi:hypothetical protein